MAEYVLVHTLLFCCKILRKIGDILIKNERIIKNPFGVEN